MLEQPLEKTTVGYGPVCRQIPDLSQTRGALHLLRIQRGFCHPYKKESREADSLSFGTPSLGYDVQRRWPPGKLVRLRHRLRFSSRHPLR